MYNVRINIAYYFIYKSLKHITMVKKQEIIRNYKSKDSKLIQRFDNMYNTTSDNIVHFNPFGFSLENLDEMKKNRDKFSNLPTDEEINALKAAATMKKDEARKNLEKAMKAVLDRIGLHFGKTSIEMKQAGGEALTNLSDADFCQKARRVERTGRKYLEDLKAVKLTPEILDNLNKTTEAFDELIDKQKDQVVQREIKTRERVACGNAVYAACVKLHNLAHAALTDVDVSLLENYRLTDIQRKKGDAQDNIDPENNQNDLENTEKDMP